MMLRTMRVVIWVIYSKCDWELRIVKPEKRVHDVGFSSNRILLFIPTAPLRHFVAPVLFLPDVQVLDLSARPLSGRTSQSLEA